MQVEENSSVNLLRLEQRHVLICYGVKRVVLMFCRLLYPLVWISDFRTEIYIGGIVRYGLGCRTFAFSREIYGRCGHSIRVEGLRGGNKGSWKDRMRPLGILRVVVELVHRAKVVPSISCLACFSCDLCKFPGSFGSLGGRDRVTFCSTAAPVELCTRLQWEAGI